MKKTFIVFTIIAIVTVFTLSFLIQDKPGKIEQASQGVDEASQIEQDVIKLVTTHLREKQVREYEMLVEVFMDRYPLTVEDDVWRLIVTVIEIDYACREQIDTLQKGK